MLSIYICPRYTLTALFITLGNVESIRSAFCSMQTTFCCRRQLRLCRKLVLACEGEIHWLGMSINVKKSACMRIGPRFSVTCPNVNTIDGSPISWCNNIRYPGVYFKKLIEYSVVATIVPNGRHFIKHSTPYLVKLAVWHQKK